VIRGEHHERDLLRRPIRRVGDNDRDRLAGANRGYRALQGAAV
jgi:hypothetical protein